MLVASTTEDQPAADIGRVTDPPVSGGPASPRQFDAADEDSAGLLLAGVISAAVWLVVAVAVWRKVTRRRPGR